MEANTSSDRDQFLEEVRSLKQPASERLMRDWDGHVQRLRRLEATYADRIVNRSEPTDERPGRVA
jgi:hypothetical protein